MLRDPHAATRTSAPAIPADLDTTDDGALPWEYGCAPDDGDVGAHEWTNVTSANDRYDGGEAA